MLRMPAEWEKQSAIWFTWPQNAETWTPVWEDAKAAYKDILRTALRFQDVMLLVGAVIIYCVLLVLFNFIVDILYGLLDKRIKVYG